ncbi:MAG TPA: hypothetical protein DCM32_01225 [Xanthomonadaceae bacterium]|nr:hypothetical protein [Xanthomonadaceae bacterium]
MNARLRNSLSALAVVAGALSLGLAAGSPAGPGLLDTAADRMPVAASGPPAEAEPSASGRSAPGSRRAHLRLPFYPFGQRAGAGAPR